MKMKLVQTYIIESDASKESIIRAFADSVNFMMDPLFVGLDMRDENSISIDEVPFKVEATYTHIEGVNELVRKKKLVMFVCSNCKEALFMMGDNCGRCGAFKPRAELRY